MTKGIIIASDETQEWMIPWWFNHYSKQNDYPVTLVNLGLSWKAEFWAEEKMNVISLSEKPTAGSSEKWADELDVNPDDPSLKDTRSHWFSKPFAMAESPYEQTLWIDSDCQVLGNLAPLFETKKFSLARDPLAEQVHQTNYPIYNTGVIAYTKNDPILTAWMKAAHTGHQNFRGDQDLLSHLLSEKKLTINELPLTYNCPADLIETTPNPQIIHYYGNHKSAIVKQILQSQFD